jgi:serine/threonine-protein kinase
MDRERIGKYRIVGELGRGTMGEVYKALDPVLNRHVALKTLAVKVSSGGGDETLDRFRREAQAAALLNHPNIVTVHDFGEEQGLLYMAMELLEGTDLRDAIDSDLLRTLEDKLEVMDGILAALDYAHARGVVHRDVKPANVHLAGPWGAPSTTPERQVKIMDFGLARVSTSEMTQEGIVLGTPNYMSPEQALGDKVDGRSDLFSTGAVLYELLTGHKPFEADSTPSVLFQVVHRQPPPLRRWAPDVPGPLVAVVNRALEKDRDKRFATAGEMRAAVAALRQAQAPALKAPPLPSPLPPRPEPPPLPSPGSISFQPDASAPPVPPRPRVPTPQPMPSPPSLRTPSLPPGAARPARRLPARPLVAGAGLALAVLGAIGLTLWLRGRVRPASAPAPAPSATSTSATSTSVDALTQELVRKQLQLGRRELEDKSYAAAIAEAEGALKLAPGSAEAEVLLAAARERVADLDRSVAEARRLVEAGDTEGASRALSHVLELDPRHPAAAELSARLNSVFRAQADGAAAAAREARDAALAAGATAWSLRSVDAGVSQAGLLLERDEFADATRTYLEARDAFDRARRDALQRRPSPPPPAPVAPSAVAAATPAPATRPTPPAPGPAPGPPTATATATAPAAPPPVPEPTATPPPGRGFATEATTVATPSAGGVEGFDSSDVSSRRPPQFSGRMEFEVLPGLVHPGEHFVVRILLRNDGRRAVKVRGLAAAAVADGRRTPAPVKPAQREVPAQGRALVGEYSGVWGEAGAWALEVVVTADRDETVTSRLRAN